MNTVEGYIAVEQFKTLEIRAEVTKGFAKIEQKHNLTPLKVLIGNNKFATGSTVYVPGETCKSHWASKVMKIGDIEFILMPESVVVVIDCPVPTQPLPYINYAFNPGITYTYPPITTTPTPYVLDGKGGIIIGDYGGNT